MPTRIGAFLQFSDGGPVRRNPAEHRRRRPLRNPQSPHAASSLFILLVVARAIPLRLALLPRRTVVAIEVVVVSIASSAIVLVPSVFLVSRVVLLEAIVVLESHVAWEPSAFLILPSL